MDDGELYVDGRRVESAERVLKSMAEREDAEADLDDVPEEVQRGPMARVPQRYSPELDPIQIGDKVTARQMLMDENGDVLARSGERLVVMGRDGPHWLLANGRGGRGRATTSQLRKSLTKGAYPRGTRVVVLKPGTDDIEAVGNVTGQVGDWISVRDEKTGRVDEYRSDQVDLAEGWLGKSKATQADAEFAADNVLPGADYYATDLEDVEDEEVPASVGDDDDENRPGVEADDADPEDEGEGMVEIDPETGEPVKYLDEETEKQFYELQRWIWQRTNMTMEDMRAKAGGVSNDDR
jgi:hypothetical protein